MSFLAVALSSALLLSTPLILTDRSELTADSAAAAEPATPTTPGFDAADSIAAVPADVPAPGPKHSVSAVDLAKQRTDSAVSVSTMLAPLAAASASGLPGSPSNDDEDDEGVLVEDLDDAPLTIHTSSSSAASMLAPPQLRLPFPTTLVDFAMDGAAIKHDAAWAADAEDVDVPSTPGAVEPAHLGIGFAFGI
ncbi:hypothetical protein H9P43_009497 [Blastocladiella emersonii ATCC 22665]|nr:hypothetical protein H9P43_009497 [Blastocladiella emersonii ATCC 22665]